ncbi:Type VI secretion system protein VasD [Burkholderiales bacterium 8X]|nr:Type VI secretion system protein VasD [Burkholderiales bacterium 8X]
MSDLGTSRSSYGASGFVCGRRVVLNGLALGAAMALVGCADKPPAPKPIVTPISLALTAGSDVNPDARGRASPLNVRVYALKTSGAFESADFFTLFEKDQATLGAEMVQREELLFRPGESKKLEMSFASEVKAIGVIAAYRDLDRARWREMRVIEVGKPNRFDIALGARQIRIEAGK